MPYYRLKKSISDKKSESQGAGETARSVATKRPNTAPLPNVGGFDPDELCRRLELYKQHMRQARRLREVRLEQGLKAEANASRSLERERRIEGSESQYYQSFAKPPQPNRKRASWTESTSCEGVIERASSLATEPMCRRASYIPQTAAVDFARTTTSETAGRERALRRLSASRQSDVQSPVERDRRTSMQEEALRILNGGPARGVEMSDNPSQYETSRPKSSMAALGPSYRHRVTGTIRHVEDADEDEKDGALTLGVNGLEDTNGAKDDESSEKCDKTKRLHGPYYTLEYRHDWTEKDESLQTERSRLSKRFSRMLLNVKKSEPRPASQQTPESMPVTVSRRRSSFLGLFK